jgi:hypothetical protein
VGSVDLPLPQTTRHWQLSILGVGEKEEEEGEGEEEEIEDGIRGKWMFLTDFFVGQINPKP